MKEQDENPIESYENKKTIDKAIFWLITTLVIQFFSGIAFVLFAQTLFNSSTMMQKILFFILLIGLEATTMFTIKNYFKLQTQAVNEVKNKTKEINLTEKKKAELLSTP